MAFHSTIEDKIREVLGQSPVGNILHIGACLAEEKSFYESLKPNKIYWYEPNPNLIEQLLINTKSDVCESLLFPVGVGKENGSFPFHLISDVNKTNPGCSSLRHLKEHSKMYPNIVYEKTVTVEVVNLDSHLNENNLEKNFDLVSLDTQGNDFDILSSSEYIYTSKCIVIETAEMELYEGQVVEKELTSFLESKGFIKLLYTQWAHGWGDTLYVKK